MVVSDEVRQLIDGPWPSDAMERRAYRLRADLESFVRGQVVALSLTPYAHKSAYMGLLAPTRDAFWDIRSRDPKPGLRVIGHFAEPDVFVALVWRPRSVVFEGRLPLGDVEGPNWDAAKSECREQWKALFPNHTPLIGETIGDYISENGLLV